MQNAYFFATAAKMDIVSLSRFRQIVIGVLVFILLITSEVKCLSIFTICVSDYYSAIYRKYMKHLCVYVYTDTHIDIF